MHVTCVSVSFETAEGLGCDRSTAAEGGGRSLRSVVGLGGSSRSSRPVSARPLSELFSPSDSFNANPFWNKKHPFLHHHEGIFILQILHKSVFCLIHAWLLLAFFS
jgi:hypothetical protein